MNFLSAAADEENEAVEGSKKAIQGWVDCFEKAEFKGTVFAGGVSNIGDIEGHKALAAANNFGKEI